MTHSSEVKYWPIASSNGKAFVLQDNDGNRTLWSYETRIMTITNQGSIVKHWMGWTATTGRHIKEFSRLDKKGFMALKYYN